ncbi:Uncharacterised protein [Anaerococcus prevotii]|uniref:DUF4298 domain-containing protein n=1 Tax=Anaerococcus prevotii (strain ATCC 9321 / DSM 20548 / JCM 6508 / NCTC 11806 / PC1) TaxID=525919 RepID=C7RHQ9_ANAPD|nr:DUF4298 domain-containing protein [Anaerococcus prevotii]ACV29020.1 conserved hypothetical protein [Anaerococcus prevotii DSM 20548]SUU94693.1 Uncharacterised protein [Anaerococcus prevotii]
MDYNYLNELNEIYEDHEKLMENLKKALEEFVDHQDKYKRLVTYYYSEDFTKDMDASNRGEIGDDINQAVLSEDAIYDLMGENYYTGLALLETANDLIQDK